LNKAIYEDKKILLEGQLGALRDILHGIYPHVSGITCLASYAAPSCGIPASSIEDVICVLKSYVSYVGSGDFPTELDPDPAHELREINHEYGATSGRPRRLGWFDCVMARYGLDLQGATDVCLTVLDVLSHYDEIPVCVDYYDTRNGQTVSDFPLTGELKYMKPVYRIMPGWKCDISQCRVYEDLPEKCQEFVEFLEDQLDEPIRYISVGKDRAALIDRGDDDDEISEEYYQAAKRFIDEALANVGD